MAWQQSHVHPPPHLPHQLASFPPPFCSHLDISITLTVQLDSKKRCQRKKKLANRIRIFLPPRNAFYLSIYSSIIELANEIILKMNKLTSKQIGTNHQWAKV